MNRVVQVPGESIVLETVCYNLCEACNFGCTDGSLNPNGGNLACNYSPEANVNDGSCEYVDRGRTQPW